MVVKIQSPLFVILPRKRVKDKKVWLNLNIYKILNRFTQNDCKTAYTESMIKSLPNTKLGIISITFQMFKCMTKGSKNKPPEVKRIDKSNVYSVLSKYFFDTLVQNGNLEDDNDDYIKEEQILPTAYLPYGSKEYAEFTITSLTNSKK